MPVLPECEFTLTNYLCKDPIVRYQLEVLRVSNRLVSQERFMGAGLVFWPLRWDPYLCLLGVAGMELDGPLGAVVLPLPCPGLPFLLRDRNAALWSLNSALTHTT